MANINIIFSAPLPTCKFSLCSVAAKHALRSAFFSGLTRNLALRATANKNYLVRGKKDKVAATKSPLYNTVPDS